MPKLTKIKVNNKLYTDEDLLKGCSTNQITPTILPPVERIIALGDIHGDLDLAIKSFKLAKLINNNLDWIAKPPNTIVVQVGDQIDSCRPIAGRYNCHKSKKPGDIANDMNVIDFFDQMHVKASAQGGAVYSLLGNHELMNTMGDFNYVSYANYYEFDYKHDGKIYRGPSGRKSAFKQGGPIAAHLACTRNSVIVIGSTMFAHAGVLPVLAERLEHLPIDSNTKLEYLNMIVRKWLLNMLPKNDSLAKIILKNPKESVFWNRIYGSIANNADLESAECSNSVKETLDVFKIGHIVVGHTPQLFSNTDGINGTCYDGKNNRLYRVDGGFSHAFKIFDTKNIIQVLEIINDKKFNILTDENHD